MVGSSFGLCPWFRERANLNELDHGKAVTKVMDVARRGGPQLRVCVAIACED